MAHLIDKDAVLAIIEKELSYYKDLEDRGIISEAGIAAYRVIRLLKSDINSLEVKEVELEKEISFQWSKFCIYDKDKDSFVKVAKHFFELGMLVNNPITAADRGMAEEIITHLKRVENDYRINLTKEMEWLRNKVKKGE